MGSGEGSTVRTFIDCTVHLVRVNKSRRWIDHLPRMEGGRRTFKILMGKPTGKRETFKKA